MGKASNAKKERQIIKELEELDAVAFIQKIFNSTGWQVDKRPGASRYLLTTVNDGKQELWSSPDIMEMSVETFREFEYNLELAVSSIGAEDQESVRDDRIVDELVTDEGQKIIKGYVVPESRKELEQ